MDNQKLIKKLWATAREYGVDSEQLHDMANTELCKVSIRSMTQKELLYMIDRIKGKQCRAPDIPGMVTYKQKCLIESLAKKLGWDDNPARLAGFIRKYAKTDSAEWLTRTQASSIIEGLKKMIHRTQRSDECGEQEG